MLHGIERYYCRENFVIVKSTRQYWIYKVYLIEWRNKHIWAHQQIRKDIKVPKHCDCHFTWQWESVVSDCIPTRIIYCANPQTHPNYLKHGLLNVDRWSSKQSTCVEALIIFLRKMWNLLWKLKIVFHYKISTTHNYSNVLLYDGDCKKTSTCLCGFEERGIYHRTVVISDWFAEN